MGRCATGRGAARRRTPEAVIEALRAGRYYSSSGAEVLSVEFIAPRRLRVRCSPVRTILFRGNGALGNGLHTALAGRSALTAAGGDSYAGLA